MHERKVEPDVHIYTSIICWNCKAGNLRMTFMLFDEMAEKGIAANVHTYGALIGGVYKAGKVEAAEILLNEMQSKGFDVNQVVFNTIDGYCRKGFINKAIKVLAVMEKKGFNEDIFTHNVIDSGLSKLNRQDEAKGWLFSMLEKGLMLNVVSYTSLIMYCKEGNFVEAKRLFRDMEQNGERPNVITYNVLIDGYSKKWKMKEAYERKDGSSSTAKYFVSTSQIQHVLDIQFSYWDYLTMQFNDNVKLIKPITTAHLLIISNLFASKTVT